MNANLRCIIDQALPLRLLRTGPERLYRLAKGMSTSTQGKGPFETRQHQSIYLCTAVCSCIYMRSHLDLKSARSPRQSSGLRLCLRGAFKPILVRRVVTVHKDNLFAQLAHRILHLLQLTV